ncbi:hypothetical protein QBC41DRAFT_324131 [Cercophora samala]|uniref:Uncharacterized protein n=1 Tax=Cercophora samala TaxID=330535 RepID=A0AA39ZB42_9PEZI|nr:hypothetical protein QBC41DRAFT_324131 [Cercophora samala]
MFYLPLMALFLFCFFPSSLVLYHYRQSFFFLFGMGEKEERRGGRERFKKCRVVYKKDLWVEIWVVLRVFKRLLCTME